MFCGNCGSKINDGAKFCPSCGAAVLPDPVAPAAAEPAFTQPAPEPVAPVQPESVVTQPAPEPVAPAAAEPAFTQPSPEPVAPVQPESVVAQPSPDPVAPVQPESVVTQPAPEPVAPAAAEPAFTQPAPEPVAPVVAEPAFTQPAPEPVAPQSNIYAQPIEPLQPEQPVQSVQSFPSGQQPYAQPDQGFVQQPNMMPAPNMIQQPVKKKKKGKGGLIAGLTAGAVVLGGGAVGYFGFHDDITKLVMGEKEYARMITKNSVKGISEPDGMTDVYAESYSLAASSMSNTLKTTNLSQSDSLSRSDTEEYAMASVLSMIDPLEKGFGSIPAGTSVSVDSNVDLKLGSVFAMLNDESVKKIVDGINKLTFKEKLARGDAKMMSLGIDDGNGHTGSCDIYIKDGSVLVTFPGITDKKFYISKEDAERITSKFSGDAEAPEKLDAEELKRIRDSIVDIFFKKYDEAEITFTDDTEWSESIGKGDKEITASVKGNCVKIELTGDQLKEITDDILDLLHDDEYLKDYATKAFGISEEDYEKTFDKDSDSNKNAKFDCDVTIEHIVDVHNNVIASRFTIDAKGDNKSTVSVSGIEGSDASIVRMTVKGKEEKQSFDIYVGDKKTSGTEGSAMFSFVSKKNDIDLSLECTYTDAAKKKFLDKDVMTGKFVLTLSDPDKFESSLGKLGDLFGSSSANAYAPVEDYGMNNIVAPTFNADDYDYDDYNDYGYVDGGIVDVENPAGNSLGSIFGSNENLIKEIKKFKLTYECSIEGDVCNTSFKISLGDIGSVGMKAMAEKKDENVTMPDTAGALDLSDLKSYEGMDIDFLKWSKGIVSGFDNANGDYVRAIDTAIENAEKEAKFKGHYSAYTSMSQYRISEYASGIAYELDEIIENSSAEEGIIKLWFEDGKFTVLDDAGVSGITFEDGEYSLLSEMDSVYAEAFFNKNANNGVAGVTAVFTDNKDDLPADRPNIFNYIDEVYPWGDDGNGIIGEFVVGTYPYLYQGEPTTTEIPTGPSHEYDGIWDIVRWEDTDIRELINNYIVAGYDAPDWHTDINGDKITFSFGDANYDTTCDLEYGRTVDGKPAAVILEGGYEAGLIVFDGDRIYTAPMETTSGYDALEFELERRGSGSEPVVGPSASYAATIDALAGRWSADYDGNQLIFTIDENYVFASYTGDSYIGDSYALLNPNGNSFDVYQELENVGTITYNSADDTVTLYDSTINKTVTAYRTEEAKHYDYYGAWTMESYEGLSEAEYCETYGRTSDEFAMNLDIAYYSTYTEDESGASVWTTKNPTASTVQIAPDSSMFLDCTYDPSTDRLTCVLRFDDTSETQTAVFRRGTHFFG